MILIKNQQPPIVQSESPWLIDKLDSIITLSYAFGQSFGIYKNAAVASPTFSARQPCHRVAEWSITILNKIFFVRRCFPLDCCLTADDIERNDFHNRLRIGGIRVREIFLFRRSQLPAWQSSQTAEDCIFAYGHNVQLSDGTYKPSDISRML